MARSLGSSCDSSQWDRSDNEAEDRKRVTIRRLRSLVIGPLFRATD